MRNWKINLWAVLCALLIYAISIPSFAQYSAEDVKQLQIEGELLFERGQFHYAIKKWQECLKKTDTPSIVQAVHHNMGKAYSNLGEYEKALECYEKSLLLAEKRYDISGKGNILFNIGAGLQSLGDYQQALKFYHQSLKIKADYNDRSGEGTVLENIGLIYQEQGYHEKALDYFKKGLVISRETGKKGSEGKALYNLGKSMFSLGGHQKALVNYHQALRLYEEAENPDAQRDILNNLGLIYEQLNNNNKAIEYFQKALAIEQSYGARQSEAMILDNLGNVYLQSRRYSEALQCHRKSLEIKQHIGDKSGEASSLCNTGAAYSFLGEHQKALDLYKKALDLYRDSGNIMAEGKIFFLTGNLHYRLGDFKRALDCYQESLTITKEFPHQYQGLYQILTMMGVCLKKLQKDDEAIVSLITAANTVEMSCYRPSLEKYRTDFTEDKMFLYDELIELLIQKGVEETAWMCLERAKARAYLEVIGQEKISLRAQAPPDLLKKEGRMQRNILALRTQLNRDNDPALHKKIFTQAEEMQKEYEKILGEIALSDPDYVSMKRLTIIPLSEIEENLSEDSVILEYYAGSRESCVFLIENTGLTMIKIPFDNEALMKKITDLRRDIDACNDCTGHIKELSSILLPPEVLAIIKDKKTLIVIPHGILHYLPFSLLVDDTREYLVKNYCILTELSASVWYRCLKKPVPAKDSLAAFAHGDGEMKLKPVVMARRLLFNGDTPGSFSRLPSTLEEVKHIASLFPEAKVLVGSEMTLSQVKESMKGKSIIHFAAHGVLDEGYPLFSGLVLSDGILEVKDIFSLDLEARLVVLSACKTDPGNASQGDEIEGISRAFIYAGTPMVVVSLWRVSDNSTAQLMKHFYQGLKEGKKINHQ